MNGREPVSTFVARIAAPIPAEAPELGIWKFALIICLVCVVGIPAAAQTFTTLVNFDGTNGANPYETSLVQGPDGNLYGTTYQGGTADYGTVFALTTGGALTTTYNFDGTSGSYAIGLVLAFDGNFYGTTAGGGANGNAGTVFTITPGGVLTRLYSFCTQNSCLDGSNPYATVVQGTDGNFYGTTAYGGDHGGFGTVFKITGAGTLTTLYSFCTQTFDCGDGDTPFGALIQATDGNFYGTTSGFNTSGGYGTVFKITPAGTLTTLHSFDSTHGGRPWTGLVQASDGKFYGTTTVGGTNYYDGTLFRMTFDGTFSRTHSFNGTDGAYPPAGLIQATDGDFYGTTEVGGDLTCNAPYGCGTVFQITPGRVLTTLHSFNATDGSLPQGNLVQATDGNLYGTTSGSGIYGHGTIFRISMGLAPFVKTLPAVSKAGKRVTILGTNLTGATNVTFNGTAAAFVIMSATEISATVPSGATTGRVQVTTPSGILTSDVVFRVRQ